MTPSEIRKMEMEYCLSDPAYYVRTYCHIENKDSDELIQPFDLWPLQEQTLNEIHEHKKNVILKARQLGISWLIIAYVSYTILLTTGRTAVGLSRSEEEAKELVRRLEIVFQYMPEFIADINHKPAGWSGPVYRKTALELKIMFPDGPESTFKAFPSSPGAGRSFTADLLVFDEWAFQQFAREIWLSAFPIINRPNSGKVIGLSTIDRGSLFEEIFTDRDNGFHKIFLPWFFKTF